MKRGEPPKRKTPLKRSTTPIKRTEIKRSLKPIKSKGAKAEREEEALIACRREVRYRSGGYCEAGPPACSGREHRAVQCHHVWPEDRDYGRHDADRCLDVCAKAHDWIHANPLAASVLGLLRPKETT